MRALLRSFMHRQQFFTVKYNPSPAPSATCRPLPLLHAPRLPLTDLDKKARTLRWPRNPDLGLADTIEPPQNKKATETHKGL